MAGLRPLKAWPPSLGVQSTLDGKKNILETAGVVYPRKTDRDRPWLPYHPPERSARSIESARMIYEDNGFPNLSIPIRTVNLLAGDSITCARHALHLYIHEGDGPDTKPTNERFLFHGCSTAASPALLQSFAKMGPSIYFSRPKSYLSRGPAVYWTDSFEFALAWCVFTKTGKWMANEPYQSRDFECLIYVSKVNINDLSSRFDTHLINTPSSIEEEQNLVDFCFANMDKNASSSRIKPPGSDKAGWSLLGSRIPKHTIDSLLPEEPGKDPIIKHRDIQTIWLYAACDEATSHALALLGVEIIHISNLLQSKIDDCVSRGLSRL